MADTDTLTLAPTTTETQQRGSWRLERHLGAGGFGQTWVGRHVDTGQVGVVKLLHLERVGDWKTVELFEREVATLKSLQHQSIPRLLDSGGMSEGHPWLVMEYRKGQALSERVKRRQPLTTHELEQVALQALQVLAYLHSQPSPVIHRDIKPSNLLWSDDGELSLVDFGSVRHALKPDGGSTVAGTFGYLAPEQLYGEATPQSDYYSLGLTLAALATGLDAALLPREGLRIAWDTILPRSPWLPLLKALTAPEPRERPQDARAALALFPGARPTDSRRESTKSPHPSEPFAPVEEDIEVPPFPLNVILFWGLFALQVVTFIAGHGVRIGERLFFGTLESHFARKLRKEEAKGRRKAARKAGGRLRRVKKLREWAHWSSEKLLESSAYAKRRRARIKKGISGKYGVPS